MAGPFSAVVLEGVIWRAVADGKRARQFAIAERVRVRAELVASVNGISSFSTNRPHGDIIEDGVPKSVAALAAQATALVVGEVAGAQF